jgi:hypothetical protein
MGCRTGGLGLAPVHVVTAARDIPYSFGYAGTATYTVSITYGVGIYAYGVGSARREGNEWRNAHGANRRG